MLEDLAGPNQYVQFFTSSSEDSFTARKGYRRGYQEYGKGMKLHPERYSNGPVIILSREEIEALYPFTK